ncbi:MAG TPA: S41 family peptidase [Thermoanaerobaculia bacterium]|nr:S41 family peptidase [Thermoanaerobaculia bacterium]
MRDLCKVIGLFLVAANAFGQLTEDQKVSDFQFVAGIYNKQYGPYEWKRDAIGFDLLNTAPWLDKVRATKNDLDFYEVMVSYVASLNDAHDFYGVPSNFAARLNFGVDIYDGKLLVDTINRTRLPVANFPFQIGYELVSIDGTDAQQILDGLLKYDIAANPRSTRRASASLLTTRSQSIIPHATDVPDISTVVFRSPAGNLETYLIPWTKTGLPMTSIGKYITPSQAPGDKRVIGDEPDVETFPEYMTPLLKLWNCQLPDRGVLGFGAQSPIFVASMPAGFTRRLGATPADVFYSGTFQSGGFKIGYIRIPSFAPPNSTTATATFRTEIAFLEQNTDGLIVDVMRNPGGSVSYLNQILALLMPTTWRSIAFEVRATSNWIVQISSSIESAKAQGAPQTTIDLLVAIKDQIQSANRAKRGRTNPIPLDDVVIDRNPAKDATGKIIAYDKPIMVLVDELSASAGDAFAATMQDNARGPLLGWRTMGAGGNVVSWEGGSYSLGSIRVTQSLMNRKNPVMTSDYPAAPYVENIGVRPEIQVDYMTRDNLTQNGKPFVDAFVAAMVDTIQKSKPAGRLVPRAAAAQNLTPSQKESDFRYLASLYATFYAPYEWKKQLLGFDLLSIQPWLNRVAATTTDLDFYEVCVAYVASLNDTHVGFFLPSDFAARLPITADIYDGKVLVETINRTALPEATYPFQVGDEIVSVDGKGVEQLLSDFTNYAVYENSISTRRRAATRIVSRTQSLMPHATDVGDSATMVVRRQSGTMETYTIAWQKSGTPLEVGPLVKTPPTTATTATPDYMRLLEETRWSGVGEQGSLTGVLNFGGRAPIFASGLPSTFTQRLGTKTADFFYSGTFKYEELTLGYIRIPNYAPPSTSTASTQFQAEIDFMNANTDGLIVDEMRNTGGNLCFGEDIATRLIPWPFQATGFQLRAYWTRMLGFYNAFISARDAGAPADIVAQYQLLFNALADANSQLRGLTVPVPLCTSSLNRNPASDASGNIIAYRKPLMLLIDEFTVSTADSVANMIQSSDRGLLYGMRTNGAGGNNTSFDAGPFSEAVVGMTIGIQTRRIPTAVPGYPTSIYIENSGVRPEVVSDYMTKDNLLQNGTPFINGFLKMMANYVRQSHSRRRVMPH